MLAMTTRALLVGSILALGAPAARAQALDYEKLARAYLASKGLEAGEPQDLANGRVLSEHYLDVPLGAFELSFPVEALEDKEHLAKLKVVAQELLAAQVAWYQWVEHGAIDESERADLAPHAKRLSSWVRKWSGKSMARAFHGGERDVLAGEDARLRESIDALAKALGRDGEPPLGRTPTHVYALPTRKEFVELACFVGWSNPHLRSAYWRESLWSWIEFYHGDADFFALEFADAGPKGGPTGDYTRGAPMSAFNERGLEQHLVQLAMKAFLEDELRGRAPSSMCTSLASELVIELYGEVDTRTDGDLRPAETSARSIFVPGVLSDGILPPDYADGRFRSPDNGADHFVRPLRAAQRAGAKTVHKRSEAHLVFELISDDGREECTVRAPVLRPQGGKLDVPSEEFRGDLLEFLRAYRIAFLHWLRTEAAGDARESRAAFAQLLRELALERKDLDEALQAVYAAPLCDAEASEASLEGRFLRWLVTAR